MPLYHLDANVGVDFLRGRSPGLRQRFLMTPVREIAMCEVAVAELLVGALKSVRSETLADTRSFIARHFRVVVDAATTSAYAQTRADLEKNGQRMEDNDLWIAATALVHGAILVTADEAFARVPGLRTENWRVSF